MFVICWRNRLTGAQGRGTTPVTALVADLWVESLNREHPDIEHWIEPA